MKSSKPDKMKRHLLTIDPSIGALGFAIHDLAGKVLGVGTIKQTQTSKHYTTRALTMTRVLRYTIGHLPISVVVMELPQQWTSIRAIKSRDAESIQKLYYTAGSMLYAMFDSGYDLWFVKPTAWKGQAPKRVMVKRAEQWLAKSKFAFQSINHHEAEAVLLGKFAYEHRENESAIRFSLPLQQVAQDWYVKEMGKQVGKMQQVHNLCGCKVTYNSGRRTS